MTQSLPGLYKDAKLISIGLISDDGREFYAEFTDIDVNSQDDWIKQNVLVNTAYYGNKDIRGITDSNNYYIGDKIIIQKYLKEWLLQFGDIQLISDVCHYDMVLFIDIFGSAFDLPENVCASCHDINQDIAAYYMIDEKTAFDFSREQILSDNEIYIEGDKHNSLYDAKVIKNLYNIVK